MKRFARILCVLDPGREREKVLDRAVSLAERYRADLSVMEVIAPRPSGWLALEEEWPEASIGEARRRQLGALVAPFAKRMRIETLTVEGIPFLCIIRKVLRDGHDLVIREGENPDWLDRLLGSDDLQLLRKCPCPVWVTDVSRPARYRRILAAVDVDRQYPAAELETRQALNRRILDVAFSLSAVTSAELHVVHAWHPIVLPTAYPGMPPDLVRDYIEQTREDHALALTTLLRETSDVFAREDGASVVWQEHLESGYPRREIPALAHKLDVDLLVMGSVGRTGVPGFFIGNTAESILGQLDRPVLVIKPPGFITPVTVRDRGSMA